MPAMEEYLKLNRQEVSQKVEDIEWQPNTTSRHTTHDKRRSSKNGDETSNGKAAGEDRIVAEPLKNGGETVIDWLTEAM